jgi:uncharacterized protein YjbJ (UPF0337 family)
MTNPIMNPNPIKLNWNDQKEKLKVKFPTLTDEDLKFEEGKKGEMFTKIQNKLSKTKEEIMTAIAK